MKKVLLTLAIGLMVFSASPAQATDNQNDLPTWFSYATEWVNLNLFTWKSESKIKVLDDLASKRVDNIQSANEIGSDEDITALADRYLQIKEKESNRIETKNISIETMNMVTTREIERQRILSRIRQESKSEAVRALMVQVQEKTVNQTKSAISKKQQDFDVEEFENNIVGAWRDPDGTIDPGDEKNTRVYAAGTTGEGIDGVLIDGGEAKITQDSGELKIEYAPGTGPSSVTSDSGQKKWTIQQSNGTVIDSYSSSGWVVIGQSNGVSSNVIVNTTSGGTSSSAQSVTGSSGGNSNVIIEGGSASVEVNSDSSGGGHNVVD